MRDIAAGRLVVAALLLSSHTALAGGAPASVSQPAGEPISSGSKTIKPPPFPATLDDAKAAAAAASQPAASWTADRIAAEKARCADILKRINAVVIPEAPIKQGHCGAAAPVQLISIGRDPEVSISPPATMTCDLADALATWISKDLQPLAEKHLGAKIIRIENMSSYSCRNAYGRTNGRLSEHGMANALDIRGFVTASAKTANVLSDWGDTGRDLRNRLAAARAAEEKARAAAKARAAEELSRQAERQAAGAADTPDGDGIARFTPSVSLTMPSSLSGEGTRATFSLGAPDKLGGPKGDGDAGKDPPRGAPGDKKTVVFSVIPGPVLSKPSGPKSAFLREAHAAACKIFGTTLGPEANEAHRNHFHVDMAARTVRNICD